MIFSINLDYYIMILYELGVYGIQSGQYDDCREEIKEYFKEIFEIS